MSEATELIERMKSQDYFTSDLRIELPENCSCKREGETPAQFVWNPNCPVHKVE